MTSPLPDIVARIRVDTSDLDRATGRASKFGVGAGAAIGTAFGGLAVAGIAKAAGAVRGFASGAVAAARESEAIGRTTAAVIKATGGAAGLSAQQVADLAERLSGVTGIDDEVIQNAGNLLLTFKNVRNEVGEGSNVFDRANAAALDLSKAGFGSVDSAAKQLGKALNDPVKGLGTLGRAGVTFTDAQKEQVKALVANGDALGAQKIVLAEVEAQVGGVAAATATNADRAKVAFGNLQEDLGGVLLPLIDKAAGVFVGAVDTIGGLAGRAQEVGEVFVGAFQNGGKGEFDGFLGFVNDLGATLSEDVIPAVQTIVGEMQERFEPVLDRVGGFIRDNLQPILATLGGALGGVVLSAVVALGGALGGALVAAVGALVGALASPIIVLGAVAGALVYAYKESDTFRSVVNRVVDFLRETVVPGFLNLANRVREYVGQAVEVVRRNWPEIQEVIQRVLGAVKSFVQGFVSTVRELWKRFGDNLLDVVKVAFEFIRSTVENALTIVRGIFTTISALIRGDWSGVWEGIKTIASGALAQVGNIIKGAGGLLREAVEVVGNLLKGAFDLVWKAVRDGIPAAFRLVRDAISDAFTGKNGILARVKDFGGDIIDKIVDGIKAAPGKIGKAITDAVGKISLPSIDLPFGDGPGRAAVARGGNTLNRVKPLLEDGMAVTSTYRSPARNRAVGGSPTSYHMDAANPAVDIVGTTAQLDRLYARLKAVGGWRELLWRVPNHAPGDNPHVHVAHNGGVVSSSWPTIAGLRADERPIIGQVGEEVVSRQQRATTALATAEATTLLRELLQATRENTAAVNSAPLRAVERSAILTAQGVR